MYLKHRHDLKALDGAKQCMTYTRRKENVLPTCVYKTITRTNGYDSVRAIQARGDNSDYYPARCLRERRLAMIENLMIMLLAGICGNSASPAGTARTMTVSKMRIADLETSAGGYAYNQQTGLPVSYVRYTNHGSGRYYRAPTPVHYVDGSSAPVAPAISETALSHEPVLLAYATAKREIVPYASRQPYPRDGFINYGTGQLAKYVQPLEPRLIARAPYYYTPSLFKSAGPSAETINRSDDKENKENGKDDYDNDGESNDDDKEDGKGHATENRKKAVDFIATHLFHDLDNPRSNIDVSLELGEKYSAGQNFAHGEKGDKGYDKRIEFDVGEREQHDKSKQQGRFLFILLIHVLLNSSIYRFGYLYFCIYIHYIYIYII